MCNVQTTLVLGVGVSGGVWYARLDGCTAGRLLLLLGTVPCLSCCFAWLLRCPGGLMLGCLGVRVKWQSGFGGIAFFLVQPGQNSSHPRETWKTRKGLPNFTTVACPDSDKS